MWRSSTSRVLSCASKLRRKSAAPACMFQERIDNTVAACTSSAKKDRQCLEIVTFEANDFDYK